MALPDLAQNSGLGMGAIGALALRWLWQEFRSRRKDVQADQSEAIALRNMKLELDRQSMRIGILEKKLDERDAEVEAERKLRRLAENELDQAQRRCAVLEDQIAELEAERGKA